MEFLKYLVTDIEVDASEVRRRFCDPMEPSHKIVMIQLKEKDTEAKYKYKVEGIYRDLRLNLDKFDIIVGQNIKFDLLYLWNNPSIKEFIARGGLVWDTKLVDFLIQGQNKKLKYSLSDICKRYKTSLKDDKVKSYFEMSYKFSEIPKEIAIPYGLQDVVSTEEVYLKQLDYVKKNNLLDIVLIYLKHYVALIAMEYNGLYVDRSSLCVDTVDQEVLVKKLHKDFNHKVYTGEGWNEFLEFDINSPQHISYLLFGGVLSREESIPMLDENGLEVRFKTGDRKGEVKNKREKIAYKIKGLHFDKKFTESAKKEGVYKTSDKELSNYDNPLIRELLEYRREYKTLSTYYKGYAECINPHTGCIHPSINATGTATGRLSMRTPNLQNISPAIHKRFISRYPNGVLISLDFSQLEVRIAAIMSQDLLLQEEIKNSIDIHTVNAARLHGVNEGDVTKSMRSAAKAMTFGLLYGQGYKGMSKVWKIPEGLCQQFIEFFYNKYLGIAEWHENLKRDVYANKFYLNTALCSKLISPLGKRYVLTAYEFRDKWDFSPNEYKNYLIQGSATDVANAAFYAAYKTTLDYHTALCVNEIHDEILIDYGRDNVIELADAVKSAMEIAANDVVNRMNFKFTVPIIVEYNIGNSLEELKK